MQGILMSRIAKDPVNIPESVNITTEGQAINFKGPKGEMTLEVHESISFTYEENSLHVKWKKDETRAMAGSMRALMNNYVKGVGEVGGDVYDNDVDGNGVLHGVSDGKELEMEGEGGIEEEEEQQAKT